ncbi:MAG TPA: FmdB family zinc ribbon protein, partial [Pseudolabrys sp.]
MPTYEYMCKKCGPFTRLRAMAECDLPSACPEC